MITFLMTLNNKMNQQQQQLIVGTDNGLFGLCS